MTSASPRDLENEGWIASLENPFSAWIGPIWHRYHDGGYEFLMATEEHHGNKNGVLHGGALATFADHALGAAVRYAHSLERLATVSMQCQFVDVGGVGELLWTRPEITRVIQSVAFVRGDIRSGDRVVMFATSTLKIAHAR